MNKHNLCPMTLAVILIVFLSTCIPAGAVEPLLLPGRVIEDRAEQDRIVRHLGDLQKGIDAIRSSASQDRGLTALDGDIHTEGIIIIKRPNMLRWESSAPVRSVIVSDGVTMTRYYPEIGEAEQVKIRDDFAARNTMDFFASLFWGSLDKLEQKFSLKLHEGAGQTVFVLMPRSKMLKRFVKSLSIEYDTVTGLPVAFDMTTPGGDRTVTRFFHTEVNPDITPGIFKIVLAPGIRIINQIDSTEAD